MGWGRFWVIGCGSGGGGGAYSTDLPSHSSILDPFSSLVLIYILFDILKKRMLIMEIGWVAAGAGED